MTMADRLRLAMVVDSDALGGAEVYARHLLHRAPAWVDPTLLVAAPLAPYFTSRSPARVIPLGLNTEWAPALASALADVGPDVVHVNLVNPASNRAALRAAHACAPTVVTLHDLGADTAELRGLYSNLAAAVAPSAVIARQLRDDLGVPAGAIHRIRNGVDLPARVAYPADRHPLVVGAVGRLADEKGLDLLIEAVSRLDRGGRRLRVVIAGLGPKRERLEQQARGLPITFPGLCRDVPALLRGLDLFCLPSRREGLPLALLEAMAHAVPCVATAVGDIAEAVGSDALVVPPNDVDALVIALDRLLDDPALRRDLGRRARLRALRDFDAERMVTQTMRVLAGAVFGARSVSGPPRPGTGRRSPA
ncbi:MAG TPA: glycosyltransferase family 4 protein [Planosporangium sp.]|jgi:glycosyltransferase involved in cell wall biosynthesis|nr:glycosyltransferase family 4 protein [Planosporangium sp.]